MNQKALVDEVRAVAKNAPEVVYSVNRMGYTIDGQRYRRVTSLVSGGIPKPQLMGWAKKVTATFAVEHKEDWINLPKADAIKLLQGASDSERDAAAARGTAVHQTLEALLSDQPMPQDLSEDEQLCAEAAADFLVQRDSKHLGTELTVFSPAKSYAGTLDLWEIDRDGQTWILDYKTSKSGVFPEMALQQLCYQRAEYAVVQSEPVSDVDNTRKGKVIPWKSEYAQRLGIVHVTPKGAVLHPVTNPDSLVPVLDAAMLIKQWLADTNTYKGREPRERVYEKPATVH